MKPGDLFWPQTTSCADDICIACSNLRFQGHRLDCTLTRAVENYDAMLTLLRQLEYHNGQCPMCKYVPPIEEPGHAPGCPLGTLLDRVGR